MATLTFVQSCQFSTRLLTQSGLNPALPFYILGAVGIVASAVAVNLPETADQKLADTVEEAEEFGRGQVLLSVVLVIIQ